MAAGAGLSVAQYHQFVSMPDLHNDLGVDRRPSKSLPVWNSRTAPLSDVLRSRSTPTVVRDLSAGGRRDESVKRDGSSVHRDVYVHSVTRCGAVLADGLAADRRCGLQPTGRRYLIPVDHRGWFELLSQDGLAATPITAVQQLMKLAPERYLVRRTIVGLSADGDAERRELTIGAGETLRSEGVVSSAGQRGGPCLRCRVDSTGQSVLLAAHQRGMFSPVAGPTSVAGVHRMRSVVAKFRLPVVVRLITRDSVASATVAFRVTSLHNEPTANVVPLWLVSSPSQAGRRSVLSLPTCAQVSSVLDGVTTTTDASAWETWKEADWIELRQRCDDLIQSNAVTAELTRLFPSHGVDDPQRNRPATSPQATHRQPPTDDDWRLLREIDHIYESIKAGEARPGRKNGVRGPAALSHQTSRRYRGVQQDQTGAPPAAFHNGGALRAPARRSNTLDSSHGRTYHVQQQLPQPPRNHTADHVYLHTQPRHASPSPGRLRRVMSTHITTAPGRLQSSPPRQRPQQLLQEQQQQQQQQHNKEPVYEELKIPVSSGVTTGEMLSGNDMVDSGQYVELSSTHSPDANATDNLRQILKINSPTMLYSQPNRPQKPDQSRRWSVALGSACQLEVFDDSNNHVVATQRQPTATTAGTMPPAEQDIPQSDTASRSLSSGRLTSSSSDDVTAADRKSPASALAAVTSTLKRALRRHTTNDPTAAARAVQQQGDRAQMVADPLGGPGTSRHRADDVAVTSQAPTDVMFTSEYDGGKVTYF